MEVITWFVFMGWAILYFVRYSRSEPLEFFGLCVGIGLVCIARAIKENRKEDKE